LPMKLCTYRQLETDPIFRLEICPCLSKATISGFRGRNSLAPESHFSILQVYRDIFAKTAKLFTVESETSYLTPRRISIETEHVHVLLKLTSMFQCFPAEDESCFRFRCLLAEGVKNRGTGCSSLEKSFLDYSYTLHNSAIRHRSNDASYPGDFR